MSAQENNSAKAAPAGLRRRAGGAGFGMPGPDAVRRPRRRRNPGARLAVLYAVLVHLLLIAVLFTGLRWSSRPQPPAIQAYIATEPAAEPRGEEQKPPPREAGVLRKVEEETRAVNEKRRVEEEKKRAVEKRKAEEKQRRQEAEQSLKKSLAAEASAREQAVTEARVGREVDRYVELVRGRVSRAWSRPLGTRKGLKCTVFVRVAPGGEVLEARIVRSSGDVAFDRSVENAVYKAVPLPVPPEQAVFNRFREIEFVFNPEE